jgi:hypothetical protein
VSAYLFFLAFPSGRLLRRWMLGLLVLFAVLETITVLTIYNQLRIGTYLTGLGIFYGIVIVLLIWRYRRHFTLTQRLQTRWFILSLIIVLFSYIVSTFLTTLTMFGMWERTAILVTARLGFLVVPFLVAFSILRYRLYEVDLVINRSLVYGALTTVLLVLFVLGFFAVQTAIQLLTHGEQPTIAAGIAILVVLVSFYPTRARLQHFVDRRFFGLRMDLEQLEKRARLDAPDAKGTPGGLTGKRLGLYEVGMLFARGGMGELYLGKHVNLGKTIAIKVMPSELASKEEFRARFEREAKIVTALGHPNIVNTFDYGVEADTFYMVMDYIDGQELADVVRQGAIAHTDSRPILRDVARALDYVHAHGLVHRDVKPSNVMLRAAIGTEQQRAILMDFGIAKSFGDESSLTQTGLVGTVDYAAPEQIMSARDVTTQADIYSLGVMAYQMLTGELPFKGSIGQIVFAHLQQPPPDPRSINASIPDVVANAIMRAMSKDAAVRFATAGEFSAALTTEMPAALSA